jgi:hypothetical protein
MEISFKNFLPENTQRMRDIPDRHGVTTDEDGKPRVWVVPPFDAETEIALKELQAAYMKTLKEQEETPPAPDVQQKNATLYWAEQIAIMVKDPDTLDAEQLAEGFHVFTLRTIAEGLMSFFRYGLRPNWMNPTT